MSKRVGHAMTRRRWLLAASAGLAGSRDGGIMTDAPAARDPNESGAGGSVRHRPHAPLRPGQRPVAASGTPGTCGRALPGVRHVSGAQPSLGGTGHLHRRRGTLLRFPGVALPVPARRRALQQRPQRRRHRGALGDRRRHRRVDRRRSGPSMCTDRTRPGRCAPATCRRSHRQPPHGASRSYAPVVQGYCRRRRSIGRCCWSSTTGAARALTLSIQWPESRPFQSWSSGRQTRFNAGSSGSVSMRKSSARIRPIIGALIASTKPSIRFRPLSRAAAMIARISVAPSPCPWKRSAIAIANSQVSRSGLSR